MMIRSIVPSRLLRPLAAAGVIAASLACAAGPSPATPAEAGAEATAAAQVPENGAPEAEAGEAVAGPAAGTAAAEEALVVPPAPGTGLIPESAEWLLDVEGRYYFIDKVAKVEGRYTRLEDGTVRVRNLMPIVVDHEDDESFYFRVYHFPPAPPPQKGPTPEEVAALEASFEAAELAEVDRLEAVRFDEGLPWFGQWRNGFDVADMNGDGHLDIVHGPARKGDAIPTVFLGDGAGNWRAWEATYPPIAYDYGDAAAADFDGDGRLDIALAMHMTGVVVLVRDGEASFRRAEGLALRGEREDAGQAPVFTSRTLADVDLDGDGLADLLALAEGPMRAQDLRSDTPVDVSAVVAFVRRDGAWEKQVSVTSDEGFGSSIAVADFDGDGRLDFATGSNLRGYDRIVKLAAEDGGWEPVAVEEVRRGALVWSVVAEDFDVDGRPDLAVAYFASRWGRVYEGIDILYNRLDGTGGWERVPLVASRVERLLDGSYPRYTALAAGDVDGDGRPDLAALTAGGSAALFLGKAGGGFAAERSPELAAGPDLLGCTGYHLELADLDGDGRVEMVAGFAGEAGSEQLTPVGATAACRSEGALRAWKLGAR